MIITQYDVNGRWALGYFAQVYYPHPNGWQSEWNTIRVFDSFDEAARMLNYLNGGTGDAPPRNENSATPRGE